MPPGFNPYRHGRETTSLVETAEGSESVTTLLNTADTEIDPATEQTLGDVLDALGLMASEATLAALADALGSNADDTLRVDLQSSDAGDLPITLEGNNAGTLTVAEEGVTTPLDADEMSPVSATTTASGEGSAASVALGTHRSSVSVGWDVSGAAAVRVEGSNDGGSSWHPVAGYSPSEAEVGGDSLDAGWEQLRIWADANVNELAISGKGA